MNKAVHIGNPHVAPSQCYGGTSRFDEGEVAPAATPRRGSLLYKLILFAAMLCVLSLHALVGASLTILEPADGSVVETVRSAQREFLNRPLDVCRERFHDKSRKPFMPNGMKTE